MIISIHQVMLKPSNAKLILSSGVLKLRECKWKTPSCEALLLIRVFQNLSSLLMKWIDWTSSFYTAMAKILPFKKPLNSLISKGVGIFWVENGSSKNVLCNLLYCWKYMVIDLPEMFTVVLCYSTYNFRHIWLPKIWKIPPSKPILNKPNCTTLCALKFYYNLDNTILSCLVTFVLFIHFEEVFVYKIIMREHRSHFVQHSHTWCTFCWLEL